MSQWNRALAGVAAAGVLALPLIGVAVAAPAKKAAKKKPAAKAAANTKGSAAAGKQLFSKEGCTGCHRSKDYKEGGEMGPDLSTTGGEHTQAQLVQMILDPKKHLKKDTVMPALQDASGKPATAKAGHIAAYLMTQK